MFYTNQLMMFQILLKLKFCTIHLYQDQMVLILLLLTLQLLKPKICQCTSQHIYWQHYIIFSTTNIVGFWNKQIDKTFIDNNFCETTNFEIKKSVSGNITITLSDHLTQFFLIPDFFSKSPPSKYNILTLDWKIWITKNF